MHTNLPASAIGALTDIAEHPEVESIILFGSRAHGDHDERSDIDLAVKAPRMTRRDWARLRDRISQTRSLFWISLVHFDENPAKLQERILQTGIVIYEKKG